LANAIVVGSGFGGLAAALRLQALGYQVTLIERNRDLGGRARSFSRGGFVFDAGPTVVTAPFLFEELFQLFGKKLSDYATLVPLETWYRIRFDDGFVFDYSGDEERTIQQIRQVEPDDVQGYHRLLERCNEIFQTGFVKLGCQPFHDWRLMLQVTPQLMQLGGFKSVYALTSQYLKNEYLRKIFSFQPLLVGGSPFTTTSIYSLIQTVERSYGIHFAMGGTGSLVNALVRLFRENSGEVFAGVNVVEVLHNDGKATGVKLEDGREFSAEVVVCNGDAPFLYRNMLPSMQKKKKWTAERIDSLKFSMGLFVLYLGVKREYPDLAHHTIMLGPNYKETIDDIFAGKFSPDNLSLYLHAPTRTDPSLAPDGCENMYLLIPVPNLQSGTDWKVAGEHLSNVVVDHLERTVCPELSKNIVEKFFITPEYFRDELQSMHGAGFSIQPVLTQSAFFRFHNKSEELKNLYLVGAGTHPGAGLPGVLCSAKVVETLIKSELPLPVREKQYA
jgi:phytoene desaturase